MPAIDFINEYNTCSIDACINSILNSNSLCNELTTLVKQETDPFIFSNELFVDNKYFSYFCDNEKCYTIKVFYKYLLCEFVIASSAEHTLAQKEIRNRLLFLFNRKDYENKRHERIDVRYIMNRDVALFLEKEFQEYIKNPLGKDGASNKFIRDAFPLVPFHRTDTDDISNEIQLRLSSCASNDVYISIDFTSDISNILEANINCINSIVDAVFKDYEGYMCSDLIISQWALSDKKPKHSAYYNMLDNTFQSNNNIVYYPLEKLKYEQNNIHDIVFERMNNDSISICNFDPWKIFSINIIECIHFQKVPLNIDKKDIPSLIKNIPNKNAFLKRFYDKYEKLYDIKRQEVFVHPSTYFKSNFENDWNTYKNACRKRAYRSYLDDTSSSEEMEEPKLPIEQFANLSYVGTL